MSPTNETAPGPVEARLALAVDTLQGLACDCLDSIELSRVSTDTDADTLSRLLADRFRLMGAEIEAVLREVAASGIAGRGPANMGAWLFSPSQTERAKELRGEP